MLRIFPWRIGCVPLCFAIVFVLQFQHAGVHMDTARDWAAALAIARGEALPLLGPEIGGLFHLGPIWHYVLAVPLLAGAGFAAVALWVAGLASTQFFLAFALGERWRTGAGGLFCAALTLPIVTMVYLAGTTHTVMLVPCVLACVLAHLRFVERPTTQRALALGLSVGLALHAHPTTGLLALSALWCSVRFGAQRGRAVLACLAGGLVLFTPLLFAPLSVPDAQVMSVTNSWVARAYRIPQVLFDAVIAPVRMQFHLLPDEAALSWAAAVAWALALALALAGGWRLRGDVGAKRVLALAVTAAVANVVLATLARNFVTFYMVGLLTVTVPVAFAIAWSFLPQRTYGAIVGVALALHIAYAWASVQALHARGMAMNIAHIVYYGHPHAAAPWALQPMWPATTMGALEQMLCAPGLLSLHGPAVPGIDLVADVLMQRACPETQRPRLGGPGLTGGLVGVPCHVLPSTRSTGGVCWHPAAKVDAAVAFAPAERNLHPPRKHANGPMLRRNYAESLAPGDGLIVTQLRMEWSRVGRWSGVTSDHVNLHTGAPWWRAYVCRAGNNERCWVSVEVTTDDPAAMEAVVISGENMR
jgi:hypothetical protein